MLYHLVDGPNKGANTHFGVAFVETSDVEEKFLDLLVGDDGHDGVVHLGPGVGASMWVAVVVTATLDVLPEGESADAQFVEHEFDACVVGLVINDHYTFHDAILR